MARAVPYDLLSVGDTTTDVFLELHDASIHCHLKRRECLLCISYADKVAVERVTTVHAVGNAANNANGSARLGLRAAIWTLLGHDENGDAARDVFRAEGVDPRFVETDRKRKTNYSVVLNFQAERTILVYHEHRTYRFPTKLPHSRWVYLTSMGQGWEAIAPGLLRYLKRTGAKLGFNPGTHQIKSGLKVLRPLFRNTEALIVNVEEAQRILKESSRDVGKLLRALAAFGPKMVVVTDGRDGSHAWDGTHHFFMPIYPDPKPVVERTGCGDSYSTGFLAAFMHGGTIRDGMQWGSANARMVVQFIGAREGLQTQAEILRAIRRFPRIVPKKE
jgi:sugar/nucleoside kinase (ribokinase family)